MAFVTEGSQAFLSGNDDDDDNFAALDSMTSGMNNQSAFMSHQLPSGGGMTAPTNNNNNNSGGVGDGGELGESLFDRIRRRTEEQQRQQKQQQQQTTTPTPTAPSAFVSQQPSAESSMELGLEREPSDGIVPPAPPTTNVGNAFDAAVQSVDNRNNNNDTAENTYSFAATTGEDFSFQPTAPAVPTYGPSRNDPSYYSGANSQQYPASFQEKAAMALNDAGSTIQSLFGKGMAGASTLVSSAQERMGGGGGGGGRGGYNNNFLLREDSMEQGIGSNNVMQQPPPPPPAAAQMGQSEAGADPSAVSGQAYSMISYAKTFCEDLYGFFMQLPPLGKAGVAVVLLALWLLMRG